jgi:hypothetical protein
MPASSAIEGQQVDFEWFLRDDFNDADHFLADEEEFGSC